jgi:mono/diheme cytochrome c family protein
MTPGILSVALVAAFLACLPAGPANAQQIERGRALAERLCAVCHMNEAQGEKTGPMGVPSFTAIANRPDQSLEGVVSWLRSVPPVMPNHHLSQDEIFLLAEFIMSLRRN